MKRSAQLLLLGAVLAAGSAAASCGDVPTLENGIAYFTPVQLPSPAVAAGDTLRDSLGVATRLRVHAFTRDSQEIAGLDVTFLPTVLPSTVDIADGFLIAHDTVGSVQLVGRVSDRLQTSVATLLIVPQPLSIDRPSGEAEGDTVTLPALRALPVTVTGVRGGTRTPVNGILVRYRIDSLAPATLPRGSAILATSSGVSQRPDSTISVDTTKNAGNATRSVLVLAGSGVQKVYVSVTARRLNGPPLQGSPVRIVVVLK